MTTLHELRRYARESLDELVEIDAEEGLSNVYHFTGNDLHDTVHELADGLVPVYTSDLMSLAADNLCLATDEPELGPAFGGEPTAVNIIAANVFEWLTTELWEYASELEIV